MIVEKTLFVMILLLILLTGCSTIATNDEKLNNGCECKCEEMGYVPVEDVNEIIELTNQGTELINDCYNESLNNLSYYKTISNRGE